MERLSYHKEIPLIRCTKDETQEINTTHNAINTPFIIITFGWFEISCRCSECWKNCICLHIANSYHFDLYVVGINNNRCNIVTILVSVKVLQRQPQVQKRCGYKYQKETSGNSLFTRNTLKHFVVVDITATTGESLLITIAQFIFHLLVLLQILISSSLYDFMINKCRFSSCADTHTCFHIIVRIFLSYFNGWFYYFVETTMFLGIL